MSLSPQVCGETDSASVLAELGKTEVEDSVLMAFMVKAVNTGDMTSCGSEWIEAECGSAPELVAYTVDAPASVKG